MSKREMPIRPGREKPELLAPAGSVEVFFAALEEGADAIYVGTPRFNARLRANNFSLDELARMIAYAHSIDRRVYITLNTLVKEAELPLLTETLDSLRRIGPDALIIQDWGTYHLARELAPEVPLHASTQMTIHNLDSALQAERMGFERAILARELTLEEITYIRRSAKIELESFIHGAMCYSISGQCNFSSYAHGKSANRGQCLQPCRRLYDVGEERTPLFAPRDLGTAPILAQLMKAGISCFKIEGRLKPAETVAQIVAAYRLLIDAYPKITGDVVAEARDRLRLAIGRKQSTGFYLDAAPQDGKIGNGMSRPGLFLGYAEEVDQDSFELQSLQIIKVGDRISVQKSRHEAPKNFKITELYLWDKPIERSRPNQIVRIVSPFPIEEGAGVIKQIDADATPSGARSHEDKKWSKATQHSRATIAAALHYSYEGSVRLEAKLGEEVFSEEAWPSFEETLELKKAYRILKQATDAPLRLAISPNDDFPDGVPMTPSELDALRNSVLAQAAAVLDKDREKVLTKIDQGLAPKSSPLGVEEQLVYVKQYQEAAQVLQHPQTRAIVSVLRINEKLLPKLHQDTENRDRIIWALPDFSFGCEAERVRLQSILKELIQQGCRSFMVSNPGHFTLLRPYMRRNLEIYGGDPLHGMNSAAYAELIAQGATKVVYAMEGDRENLHELARKVGSDRLIVTLFGKVPLFRSRNPWPNHTRKAACVVESNEVLQIRSLDALTYVTPDRDFSLRHCMAEFRELGIESFLYDLRHSFYAAKELSRFLAPRRSLDPRKESDMNFSRGLS